MGSEPEKSPSAAELFEDFLARQEAGEAVELAALCAEHPALAGELRALARNWQELGGVLADLGVTATTDERAPRERPAAGDPGPGEASGFARDVLERLGSRSSAFQRYRTEEEVARGGQGAILRVWDDDLQRHLAMKVMLAREERRSPRAPGSDTRSLGRFLEEAQVTGQLDHPGIVPVHELGLDPRGRLYFTMKLVKGRSLKEIFGLVQRREEGWTLARALQVLLRVCEAMSYAHAKGVIHRDLKPANVMVRRFGEVYVMDWGLARVLGREERRDLRIRTRAPSGEIHSRRRERAGDTPDSPLLTMDGDVVGTPAFMAPEQALGALESVGPRSDLYSVGAMLYQLLTGREPYLDPAAPAPHYKILARLQREPPRPVLELAPAAPAELVAITERAMEREISRRYPDMPALAEDIQAYLEGRVVAAHEEGALAELRKWVRRNRALSAALAAGLSVLVAGLATALFLRGAEQARREEAEARRDEVLRLSARQELEELVAAADRLWPAVPERIEELETWIGRAERLMADLSLHRANLAELERARGTPGESNERSALPERDARWWSAQLGALVRSLEELERDLLGPSAVTPAHGWSVRRRLAFARELERSFSAGGTHAGRWEGVLPEIRARYGLADLGPQVGLVPLGADPATGLWEFADLQTGEPPERGAQGRLVLEEGSGVVFVLVPAGSFLMGAQGKDPDAPGFDPLANPYEGPPHRVRLEPFLLSKFELTQGQWRRVAGHDPSYHQGEGFTLLHPVENVSWSDCQRFCERLGWTLPTEARWEYAARGGTSSVWWPGGKRASLTGLVNLADRSLERAGEGSRNTSDWPELDDGFPYHSPVDRFAANPFGIHGIHGNVREWCLDGYDEGFYQRSPVREPFLDPSTARTRVLRDGGFPDAAMHARSSSRSAVPPANQSSSRGLRPARELR